MPRTADPELPHRILKAADALWQSGGEEAVTIRGVAAEAATTTPTVYSYYADRAALDIAHRRPRAISGHLPELLTYCRGRA